MLDVGSYFDIGLMEPAGNWFVGKNAFRSTTVDDRVPETSAYQVREWCPGDRTVLATDCRVKALQ